MQDAKTEELFGRLKRFSDGPVELPFYVTQSVGFDGSPIGEAELDEVPEGLIDLWNECVPYIGGEADGGLGAFFLSRVQAIEERGRLAASVDNPGRDLSDAILNRRTRVLVCPSPRRAVSEDFMRVSYFADHLARCFRRQVDELKQASDACSTHEVSLRMIELGKTRISAGIPLEARERRCDASRMEWRAQSRIVNEMTLEAQVIAHYVKHVLPTEWQSSKQLHSKHWRSAWFDRMDWDAFESELRLLEARFCQLADQRDTFTNVVSILPWRNTGVQLVSSRVFSDLIVRRAQSLCVELDQYARNPIRSYTTMYTNSTDGSSTVTTANPFEPAPKLYPDLVPGNPILESVRAFLSILPGDEIRTDEVGGVTFAHDGDRFYDLVNLSRQPHLVALLEGATLNLRDWIRDRFVGGARSVLQEPVIKPSDQFWMDATQQQKAIFNCLSSNNWKVARTVLEQTAGTFRDECPTSETVRKALDRMNEVLAKTSNGWYLKWSHPLDSHSADIWIEHPGQK